ncbi:MAG TPA: hypothetical protein ENK68_03950 [Epsilonproteobacteria bacterium]|nr:hypothetical protein [Campylobacterota bacterium]
MQVNFGPYLIKTHELDGKLTVQVFSDLGKVVIRDEKNSGDDFPNAIHFEIENSNTKPESKGLKKYVFGEYSFILGINNSGELALFHSINLSARRKKIDNTDTINLALLKEPQSF